jgi:hypothetical protein
MTTFYDLTPAEALILAHRLRNWADSVANSEREQAHVYVRPPATANVPIAFRIAKENAECAF